MATYIFEDADEKQLDKKDFHLKVSARRRALFLANESHISVWFYKQDKPQKKERVFPSIWKDWE